MSNFDASQAWVILSPMGTDGGATFAPAEELSRGIALLRTKLALEAGEPSILDAGKATEASGENAILLNLNGGGSANANADGFSWRAGETRIELYGDSPRALHAAVADLLGALGVSWPEPGEPAVEPRMPNAAQPSTIELTRVKAHYRKGPDRLALMLPLPLWERGAAPWIEWAARHLYTSVCFLTSSGNGRSREASKGAEAWLRQRGTAAKAAERFGMGIELGGYTLSGLLPKRLFWRHRDLFRMSGGKRTRDANLCPTSPEGLACIAARARETLSPLTEVAIFHLWADRVEHNSWCSCPSCRAFSIREQALMALNAVADAIGGERPTARIGYQEGDDGDGALGPRPSLRAIPAVDTANGEQYMVEQGPARAASLEGARAFARNIRSRG